jgi:hypothetical protein
MKPKKLYCIVCECEIEDEEYNSYPRVMRGHCSGCGRWVDPEDKVIIKRFV